MKLGEIVKIAAEAYPDAYPLMFWNEEKQWWEETFAGDMLAKFIVIELCDTYDEDATTEKQLEEAVRVMDRAAEEMNAVAGALDKALYAATQGESDDTSS